jgi:hypothetical protein
MKWKKRTENLLVQYNKYVSRSKRIQICEALGYKTFFALPVTSFGLNLQNNKK